MDNQNLPPNPTPQIENVPAQNSTVETPPSQVYTAPQPPPPSPKSFFSSRIVLLIGTLVIVGLTVAGFIYFQAVKPSSTPETTKQSIKKGWVGVIETKAGLVKINSQGVTERDSSGKVKTITPPWSKALGENVAIPRELLEGGEIVFIGSPEIPSALKENIIYSWNIDSQETPKPFLEIPEGQKITSLAVLPDGKHAAVISITRTSSELLEGLENLEFGSEEWKKASAEREKELQEQSRTIQIYETQTGKTIRILKLKLLESPSRRSGGGRLLWNQTGLFALDSPEITIFNPNNGQVVDTIINTVAGTGPLHEHILISPDGSKYLNPTDITLAVRKIPGGDIIAKFDAPEWVTSEQIDEKADLDKQIFWVGPKAFSQDSKKVLIQGRSVTQNNFIIWELDLESGKTQKIGDSEILKFGSIPVAQVKSLFLFLTYNPSEDRIFFAANYPTADKVATTDLFQLKKGKQKAEFMDLFDGLNVSFLGWYLK